MEALNPRSCDECITSTSNTDDEAPWILANYLEAGSLVLDCMAIPVCTHEHSSDGYHTASASWWTSFQDMLPPDDAAGHDLASIVKFLIQERFAATTYRVQVDALRIHFRIYLIPCDLPKTSGILLRRDPALLSQAATQLTRVLRRTLRREADWYGNPAPPPTASDFFVHNEQDHRTLSEVFSQLPSPEELTDSQTRTLRRKLLGFRTTLYRYQWRTLASMLRQETQTSDVPDPTYMRVHSITSSSTFYLQPSTMILRRDVPVFSSQRSGILCEDMGSGKSCILLALVLATKGQQPHFNDQYSITSAVVTPVGVRSFPWTRLSLSSFAKAAGHTGPLYPESEYSVPSLVSLTLASLRSNPHRPLTTVEETRLESVGLLQALIRNCPFYLTSPLPSSMQQSRRSSRNHIDETAPRKFYLASGTLLIVPSTLFEQWCLEVEKHCESDALKCLLVSTKKEDLPSPWRLASEYDLIVVTHERFALEMKSAKSALALDQLKTWDECMCPNYRNFSVPDCHCDSGQVTPLVQCHWKRVVIDEGHSLSNSSTYLASLTTMLRSECVWIVSGTPTTNLIGSGFSQGSEIQTEGSSAHNDLADLYHDSDSWSARQEREDLAKLESLLVTFLRLPQITHAVGSHFFRQHVAAPFLRRVLYEDGTSARPFGALKVVEQVMQQCMIRHRIEDIELEVGLPSSTKEVIMLDLHPMAAMTYNTILSLVAGNAVDSDRRDQDYFFHSNNRGALNTVIQNLSQSLFWHADSHDLWADMDRHVSRARQILEKATSQEKSLEDIHLSKTALEHLQHAQANPLWMNMMRRLQVFVPFQVHGLPHALQETWAILQTVGPEIIEDAPRGSSTYMYPDKLIALRRWVLGYPLATLDRIAEHGRSLERVDSAQLEKREHRRDAKSKKRKRQNGRDFIDKQKVALDRKTFPRGADDPMITSDACSSSFLLRSHSLRSVAIGDSVSTKLNYVLREVLSHKEDKFLIFSSSPLSLAHTSEAMMLARVSHQTIMSQVDPTRWAGYMTTFQSSDSCQCLLMEIRYGARGLNLTRATRIIFLEPVWRADEESQAIKRAHRIGQTKPISVQTLAIRGTVEEAMISRRKQLLQSTKFHPKSMLDETGMQSYIQNPRFLEPDELLDNPYACPPLHIDLLPVHVPDGDEDDAKPESTPRSDMKRVRIA